VQGVPVHRDVRRRLAAVARLRDVDQLDGPLVERPLVLGEPVPVGIGSADDDLALLQQPLEDQLDLEGLVLGFLDAAGDVLEVDEQRQLSFPVHPYDPFIRRSAPPGADWSRLYGATPYARTLLGRVV